MRGRALVAALVLAFAAPASAQTDDTVRLVVKFMKAPGAAPSSVGQDRVRFDPASCPACSLDTTPGFAADNSRETIVALRVPRLRQLELGFTGTTRRVIVETGDLAFRTEGRHLIVSIPPLDRDAITAGEYAMHIVEPGMVLRLEHADPARRAGSYATGRFPTVERQAASNLEFAQREVIRRLGLGERVARERLGTIEVMGFDTNYPHGHTDAPPHIHMHLRWPRNAGTQIGHYYIGADGLLVHNVVGVKGLGAPERVFARGETFTTIGPDERSVYAHTITPEGWLALGAAGEPSCIIRPIGEGFQSGARILCPGQADTEVRVTDDLAKATVSVEIGRVIERFRYDRDTGALTSPSTAPPSPPSVYTDTR